jgi:PAS domain S-box-containing protein
MDLKIKQDISFFKMIFNQMAEGVVIQDTTYTIVDFNQSALEILGLSEDQLLGKTSMDPSWKTIRENGTVFKNEEHPAVVTINKGIKVQDIMGVYRPNGELCWIMINASPVFDENKKVSYSICTFRDITNEKKSKDELDVLATRLNLALEIAEIGIWDFDIVNQRLIWDDRMFEVYGAKRENFSSEYEAWVNCLLPEEKIAGDLRVQEAIANKTGLDFKFKIKTIYGEIRTIVAKGKVVVDANGNAVRLVGANWNITNSEKVKEQLEQASRAKMVFLANTGHEIRTPLNGIIGSIDILRDTKLDHEQKELVETIHTCGDNLLKLLNDVLDLSKFESGKIELVKNAFNLENILSNANKLFHSIAEAKNLEFIF